MSSNKRPHVCQYIATRGSSVVFCVVVKEKNHLTSTGSILPHLSETGFELQRDATYLVKCKVQHCKWEHFKYNILTVKNTHCRSFTHVT